MHKELAASELAGLLGTGDEPFLVDVREPEEVAGWALPGVLNIPLGQLVARVDELPGDRPLVIVCASGNRSAQASQYLAATGFDVANLTGGMAAWGQVYDTATIELASASVVQVRRRAKGCLSYLVGAAGEAFVVDPSLDVHIYLRLAEERGWRISRVFDTHLHADHVSGARRLADAAGATLHLNPADAFRFDFSPLSDGDRFDLPGGAEMSVAVLHTPGHTEGSTLYAVGDEAVLSGDTLFVDGVGRPDLAERAVEFSRNLHASLHDKVLVLDDDVMILPSHHGEKVPVAPGKVVGARLGELRASLAPLSLDAEAFVAWASTRVGERPPNYQAIIAANMSGDEAHAERARTLEAGPNRCSA